MDVDLFIKTIDKSLTSCIVAFENSEALHKLYNYLSSQSTRFEQIHIGSFIQQDNYLPAPDVLFSDLKKVLNQKYQQINTQEQQGQKIFYVTGVNGLLKLWNAKLCLSAYECIKKLLDNPKFHIWFFVNQFDIYVESVFEHPKYRDAKQMITLSDDSRENQISVSQKESICLVNKKYLSKFHGITYNNFRDALKEFVTGTVAHTSSERHIYIGVDYTGSSLAGIKESIEKAYTLRDFFKLRYNLSEEDLSDPHYNGFTTILKNLKSTHQTSMASFGTNTSPKALKNLKINYLNYLSRPLTLKRNYSSGHCVRITTLTAIFLPFSKIPMWIHPILQRILFANRWISYLPQSLLIFLFNRHRIRLKSMRSNVKRALPVSVLNDLAVI